MRSNRSSSRARTTERGFALIWAVGIAVLYFMLIQLVLIDSARELGEARRFRARMVATALAENGAELAAAGMRDRVASGIVNASDWQGTISGEMRKNPDSGEFTMWGEGETRGTVTTKARVEVKGTYDAATNQIHIHFTVHKP